MLAEALAAPALPASLTAEADRQPRSDAEGNSDKKRRSRRMRRRIRMPISAAFGLALCLLSIGAISGAPHGAKGVGELPMDVGAPAVVDAIHDATGVWIHDLPASPERILAALGATGPTSSSSAGRSRSDKDVEGAVDAAMDAPIEVGTDPLPTERTQPFRAPTDR